MVANVGTGTTIAFATSSFVADILSVNGNDISREDIEITHMGTTGYKEYMPGDLIEGGTVDVEFAFDPNSQPPISGVSESITITFPMPAAGGTTAAKVVFSGYINSWSFGDAMEEKMTGTATIKVDGVTDPVWTDSV